MQNERRSLKLLIILAVVGFLILAGTAIWNNVRNAKMGQLTTTTAPDDITLIINKKQVKTNRTIYVSPGAYTWEASRQDFTSKKGTLTIKKGQKSTLDVYLQPSGQAGFDWLTNHPEQAQKIESQVGKRYDELSNEASKDTPLINKLPFIAPGSEFRVDYGSTTVNGKPKTTIYIEITSDQAKLDALDWIKSQGADPTTLTIEYTTVAPPPTSNEDRW